MAGEISYQQLMSHEFIIGVFKRYRQPISLLQRFYGVGLGSSGTKRVFGRQFGYDYFDPTRSIARGRTAIMGPAVISRKRAGHASAMCYRSHEKIPIAVEELMSGRPLGGRVGTIDAFGQRNFALQANYLAQRFTNAREYSLAHMFRGGLSITLDGENMDLGAKGSGTVNINSQIPATHLTGCAMGTGGNLLGGAWQTAGTDIKGELLDMAAAFERESGMQMKHIWINSRTYGYLLSNTGLQSVAGTANRLFESLTERSLSGLERPDTGFDVVFHGIPQFTFHIYDGVLHSASAEEIGYPDEITATNSGLLIPDTKALFTPDPSPEWLGLALGSEPIQERYNSPFKTVYGFHPWATPEKDPPVVELKAVDNFMFYFPMPRAIAYGTVST